MRFIPTLTLSLSLMISACGGSDGSGSDDGTGNHNGANPGGGGSYDVGRYRDCSLDQWESSFFPAPEYPGRLQAYSSSFIPVNYFDNTGFAGSDLKAAIENSYEGPFHQGPIWSSTFDGLTTTVTYSESNGVETWTLQLDASGQPGYDYGNAREYTIRQLANCRLEYETVDPASGNLTWGYWAETDEAMLIQYQASGEIEKLFKTKINADESGITAEDRVGWDVPHPVLITSWNSNGDIIKDQECESLSGYSCVGPVETASF